jgi:hypothetical protein
MASYHFDSSDADFSFPVFPAGLLAVVFVYKGGAGTLYTANPGVFILFSLFACEVVRERS